jgi:predicted DNA binding CopG/RHH family protein
MMTPPSSGMRATLTRTGAGIMSAGRSRSKCSLIGRSSSLPTWCIRTDAERAFWAKHEVADYFNWARAVVATLPNLTPSTTTISIRLPEPLLGELKAPANERDVPYQSLMKVFLAERIATERHTKRKVPA